VHERGSGLVVYFLPAAERKAAFHSAKADIGILRASLPATVNCNLLLNHARNVAI
jgi:hypothetical protein